MLQTFYDNFGFFGSICLSFVVFLIFIFWIAGIAGIAQLKDDEHKNTKLVFSALFPPYPFFWLLYDMYRQKQLMKEKEPG